MKKALLSLLCFAASGFLMAQDQATPGETNVTSEVTDTPESIVFTPVDYLSPEQVDAFWYLAGTSKVLPAGIVELYKGSVYVTAVLATEDKDETVLVRFDWHTGRVETYEVWKKGKIAYKLVRNPDDTFRSTDEYGYKEVEAPVEKLLTQCRTVCIKATNTLLTKSKNSNS